MMRTVRRLALLAATAFAAFLGGRTELAAQVTTSSMRGAVVDDKGAPVEGARVEAVHTPSGTRYAALTRADGRFSIPGMRVGGPYEVSVTRIGFQRQSRTDVFTSLGTTTDLAFALQTVATQVAAVTVTGEAGIISPSRTGSATAVAREQIEQLPTISRRIGDFVRLTPQASGSSFAGVDNRLNNITVDGSYFNNSFGLGGQPGDRTGVAPISIDAIEAVQVNIAPFDVRQSNFTGAAVNTVTKSGTNEVKGSLYYLTRNQDFAGTRAGANTLTPGALDFSNIGVTLGAPIIKDKLFFFGSFENDGITEPGINLRANAGGETTGGNITRVLRSDLDQLSNFLAQNFDYQTGAYEGYEHETPSRRMLAKLDYNLNDNNKFSLRYSQLDSKTDVLISTSSSLGFGNRRGIGALSFQNSNYQILENLKSLVGEWNSTFRGNMSNQLIVGYNSSDESRDRRGGMGTLFPLVEILKDGAPYTSFGFEPFTPNNELRYNSFQLQNNFHVYLEKHELTFGASFERYESENVFFPGSQSVYVYNSLQDFYTDANGYLANPNRTTSPVNLRRFQVRYANIPGQTKPVQPLEVSYSGLYAQDEWRAADNLRLTYGLRVEVPVFGNTAFTNTAADQLTFRNAEGQNVQFQSGALPKANLLWSPRVGFNWDVNNDGTTQVRGGTGIFTGRPAYVWISNQVGNTGVLTGFEQRDNTTTRPFNPNPDAYKPTAVTGAPAASYELALTEQDFRFPQVWRTNIAVDRKLPWNLVGTLDVLYGREVNGISYYNANLPAAQAAFTGPDNRPRWTSNRIHSNISNAVVLANQAEGTSYNIAASLERAFRGGLFLKTAYSYGMSRNTVDAGSIAAGSWFGRQISGDPNALVSGISGNAAGHRFFVAATYKKDWFSFGGTGVSLFYEARNAGNGSYIYSGDLNGDGGTGNDLLYIPRDVSEMNFQEFTSSGRTFTVAEQNAAWEAFITQDKYLNGRRGQYAERGAVFLPILHRADVSITQDLFRNVAGRKNTIQVRLDILNAGNLINKDWGVGYAFTSSSPLVTAGTSADGRARHRMRNFGTELISESFQRTASPFDVWRMQLGLRYNFN
jgi:outer membrane receptor protein involved in Fe transport